MQHVGNWDGTAEILCDAAQKIEHGGADFLLICTNTMHKVAEQIQKTINIPLVHIADATAEQLQADGITKVGLLGSRFTMEQDFYKSRLTDHFQVDVVTPEEQDRDLVHQVIYEELCLGHINDKSRAKYLAIIERLKEQGAQAVILGCTEIALLVKPEHTDAQLYDTTSLHARKAVELALE